MSKYTADFETSTYEWYKIDKLARVWAFAICEIENPNNVIIGNNIEDFMKFCMKSRENPEIWFHNLKFDGEYIFYYLLSNDYKYIKDKKDRCDKSFTCLISDVGQFYTIEIYFKVNKKKVNKVTIMDSMKLLNFSVDTIADKFNLPLKKLKLDYNTYRPINHELTYHEIEYIKADVVIMAMALKIMFDEGLSKLTIASNAMYSFKKLIPYMSDYYPVLSYKIDEVCRLSYKGGWTYLNPIYKNKLISKGLVIDANSMHPSQMYYKTLPFGQPLHFENKYVYDICYPLFIQELTCSFKLKKNKLPTIQLKKTIGFNDTEYIETTNGEYVTLCLTSVDLELFFMQYDVDVLCYNGGYKFKGVKGLFCNYIDKWMNAKNKAKKDGNMALYQISKLMLNSLYGKFGLNPNVRGKFPYLKDDGSVGYHLTEKEIRDSIYVPVASFITAYSRYSIITTSQKIRDYTLEKYNKDYYIYSDTDSIHMLDIDYEELKNIIDIDDYRLGAYKLESTFIKAKFLKSKCYIEVDSDNNLNTTVAGLPKKLGKYLNLSNFKIGFSITADEEDKEHKLRFMHVKGGVILIDTDFTIKS